MMGGDVGSTRRRKSIRVGSSRWPRRDLLLTTTCLGDLAVGKRRTPCQPRARTGRRPATLVSAKTTTKPVLTSVAAVESRPGIEMVRRRSQRDRSSRRHLEQDRALRVPEVGANRRHRTVPIRRGKQPSPGKRQLAAVRETTS
jgi:hypothetical protein